MDSLIDEFSTTQVTLQPNSTAAEHPHFALYKVKRNYPSQEERRKKYLAAQKIKRYDYVNHARNLATNEWHDGTDDEKENEDMEWENLLKKPPRSYKNQLMLSEWLVEIPSDLATNWLMMLCPVGKRCLVVASKGCTKAYTKSGYLLYTFMSHVPGGNRMQFHQKTGSQVSSYSLLDCIYNEVDKTYYILDVMSWNSHPCFDSETEFRFYWMHSKVEECPSVKVASSSNPYKFLPLPYYQCDASSIKATLWSPLPFSSKLDGLLFYHKQTHYTSGTTPLVGWLKAFMVPEILNIEVPNALYSDRPASYLSMQQHIPEAFEKNEKRKKEEEKNMQYQES